MKIRIGFVVLSFVLSVLVGISLSRGKMALGSGGIEKERGNGKILIGLSMDTLKEARWQKDRDVFVKRAEELGAEVLVQSANGDDSRQIQDIQSLLSRNIDVLMIIPHNGEAMVKAVNMAHDVNVPVMSYDRLITNSDLDLYVSFDNYRVGVMQAQYVADHLPKDHKMRLVRIYGSRTDNNAVILKGAQDNVLKPYIARGQIEVIHEDWADDWTPENAKKITNAVITKFGPKFDTILASNDGTAGGAIQALLEEGLEGKIVVTGQDADLVACQRIARGTQAMTVYKPIQKLASRAAEVAVKLAKRQPIFTKDAVNNGKIDVPAVLLPTVVVSKDNIMQTVIADKFHAREDVYRDFPAK